MNRSSVSHHAVTSSVLMQRTPTSSLTHLRAVNDMAKPHGRLVPLG